MVEILKSFEVVAGWLDPRVLVTPGLAMIGLGLLAWLACLCLRSLVFGLIGAAVGLLASFFVGVQGPSIWVATTAGGAAFGALLPRLSVAVLLTSLGTGIAFVAIATMQPATAQPTLFEAQSLTGTTERFSLPASLEVVRGYGYDLADHVRAIGRRFLPMHWAILASVGSGLLALSVLFGRLADAVTGSLLGAALVFAGLVLLLLFKGSAPVTRIEQNAAFYGLVLLAMAVFGAGEQLILCRRPKQEAKEDGRKSRTKKKEVASGWRGR